MSNVEDETAVMEDVMAAVVDGAGDCSEVRDFFGGSKHRDDVVV